MARTFEFNRPRRIANALLTPLIRLGLAPRGTVLLTTSGRRSGDPLTHPVNELEHGGERWLVSPYGERAWVRNVRANGLAQLRRGRRLERVQLEEVRAEAAAPVLREYVTRFPITRPYFDASPDDSFEDFAAEADRHPVFRVSAPPRATE